MAISRAISRGSVPVSSESVTEGVVFFHEIDGYERLGGARMSAVKVLLHVRCSDLGFVKRLPEMCLVARPLDAHNRRSRAFFDWFVDGALPKDGPSLRWWCSFRNDGRPSPPHNAPILPFAGGVLAILRILGAVSLTFARGRVRMQKFAFKSPVNAWVQGNATAEGCPGPKHRVSA